MIRVAINGFGRIGRSAFKVALEYHKDVIEIVAINDLTEPKVLAHLLKYDTAYGTWDKDIKSDEHSIMIDGKPFTILAEKDPTQLPWKDLNVDVVIESTGRFTDSDGMKQHLTAGARKVVLSAPAKGDGVGTFLIGVNHDSYDNQETINNASCTSNCIAPVIALLESKFGIAKGLYTTIHSVTAEQNLVDGPPPGGKSGDLRRARAAYSNMIPTTTGAAVAVTQAITSMEGKLDGRAIRVPTITGSITDFTVLLNRKTTIEEVNEAFKEAANTPRWQGILGVTEEPLVSSDIIGRSESAIVDLGLTQLIDGDLLKVFAWYDNEWGYSNRLIEQVINVGIKGNNQVYKTEESKDQGDGGGVQFEGAKGEEEGGNEGGKHEYHDDHESHEHQDGEHAGDLHLAEYAVEPAESAPTEHQENHSDNPEPQFNQSENAQQSDENQNSDNSEHHEGSDQGDKKGW